MQEEYSCAEFSNCMEERLSSTSEGEDDVAEFTEGRTNCERCHAEFVDGTMRESHTCWKEICHQERVHLPCFSEELKAVDDLTDDEDELDEYDTYPEDLVDPDDLFVGKIEMPTRSQRAWVTPLVLGEDGAMLVDIHYEGSPEYETAREQALERYRETGDLSMTAPGIDLALRRFWGEAALL